MGKLGVVVETMTTLTSIARPATRIGTAVTPSASMAVRSVVSLSFTRLAATATAIRLRMAAAAVQTVARVKPIRLGMTSPTVPMPEKLSRMPMRVRPRR